MLPSPFSVGPIDPALYTRHHKIQRLLPHPPKDAHKAAGGGRTKFLIGGSAITAAPVRREGGGADGEAARAEAGRRGSCARCRRGVRCHSSGEGGGRREGEADARRWWGWVRGWLKSGGEGSVRLCLCGGGRGSLARCGSHAPHPWPNRRAPIWCGVQKAEQHYVYGTSFEENHLATSSSNQIFSLR